MRSKCKVTLAEPHPIETTIFVGDKDGRAVMSEQMEIGDVLDGLHIASVRSAVLDDEEDARQIKLDEIAARIEREKAQALAVDVSAFERDLT